MLKGEALMRIHFHISGKGYHRIMQKSFELGFKSTFELLRGSSKFSLNFDLNLRFFHLNIFIDLILIFVINIFHNKRLLGFPKINFKSCCEEIIHKLRQSLLDYLSNKKD